jgi:hypothetical protein
VINSVDIAKQIQLAYQELTYKARAEDGWAPDALEMLEWDKLPEANRKHFQTAVEKVLSEMLPKIRQAAVEAHTSQCCT